MELRKIAEKLGISAYPAQMESIYTGSSFGLEDACDLSLIDMLQEQFDIFGEFYSLVRQVAEQINADPVRSAWIRTAVRFAIAADMDEACTIPVPETDGTPANDLLPLFILLPQIPISIDSYNARGFSREELDAVLKEYKVSIRIVQYQTGRPGINKTYYHWLMIFAKAEIFCTSGLQFQLYRLPEQALWLRNRQTKQIVPLMLAGEFLTNGIQHSGSKGYEDAQDTFKPDFSEDKQNYYGFGVFENVVSSKRQIFPKELWQCLGRPGEYCLNIHVPRGSDICRQTVLTACAEAMDIVKKRFPDVYATRLVLGFSWLLNPALEQIQGRNAKTTQFMQCFTKYPQKDSGSSAISFVFGKHYDNYADLPENTSLQRKLKKMYMEGGRLHGYAGAIYVEESNK